MPGSSWSRCSAEAVTRTVTVTVRVTATRLGTPRSGRPRPLRGIRAATRIQQGCVIPVFSVRRSLGGAASRSRFAVLVPNKGYRTNSLCKGYWTNALRSPRTPRYATQGLRVTQPKALRNPRTPRYATQGLPPGAALDFLVVTAGARRPRRQTGHRDRLGNRPVLELPAARTRAAAAATGPGRGPVRARGGGNRPGKRRRSGY